ncbi:alpha/beta hydrolase [Paucibacter sp. APW11]|uniref:Alpha/beta hydrolase n=1 Tax=Roseateles aquae TaxID=3077235 RepID=A0ABU3P6R1_9BURK|nr:alpha/beta hydrolase [Paucibacter sp. APW11]MDT8998249.1 alpha/beta hydrolase [Paucibacter sp. APW11]
MSGAPTWVLLRGLTRESGHWGQFPQLLLNRLQALQPTVRVMMLDLPGNGRLYKQPSPGSVPEMVDACRDQLARAGVSGPIHLLSMSLGAMVAADWAMRFPNEIEAAVLINTSLSPFSPFFRRLRPSNYWSLLMMAFWRAGSRWREAKVLALTTRLVEQAEPLLDRWVEVQKKRPVSGRNALRQLLAAARYRASRRRPSAPMLLLCSQADGLVDWRCSQHLSRAWGIPLRLHTSAGHDLPLDDGPWVVNAVLEWLKAREHLAYLPTEPASLPDRTQPFVRQPE